MIHRNDLEEAILLAEMRVKDLENLEKDLLHRLSEVRLSITQETSQLSTLRNQKQPVSTIPNEILSIIFEECFLSLPTREEKDMLLRSLSLFTRHWHDVAINTPSLWTHISVPVNPLWIKQSRNCPLEIEMDFGPGPAVRKVKEAMKLVVPHAYRWRSLRIRVPEIQALTLTTFPDLAYLSLPRLEELEIWGDSRFPEHRVKSRVFTHGTPRLTKLDVNGVVLYNCFPPLASVTTFQYGSLGSEVSHPFRELHQILSDMPLLTTLVLCGDIFQDEPDEMDEKIGLPVLRNLVIVGDSYSCQSVLIKAIHAPDLQTIALRNGGASSTMRQLCLESATHPKFPGLQSLYFFDSEADGIEFSELARAVPTITEIGLSSQWALRKFIYVSPGTSWPRLKTLSLPFTISRSFERDSLNDYLTHLVSRRDRLGYSLSRLRLHRDLACSIGAGTLKQLRATVEIEEVDNHRSDWQRWIGI